MMTMPDGSARPIQIQTPDVFLPLWRRPARYKGAHGGRGSGKSHDRATACVAAMMQGLRVAGIREVQRSIKHSVKQLVEDKIEAMGVAGQFDIQRDSLKHRSGGFMIFQGLQDHTAVTIKSLEGFDRAWVEEAQTISRRSLSILTPTIRKPGSELWFTWNPEFDSDAVDVLLRGPNPPSNSVVVSANYWDNPWFPPDLRADMERDRAADPETYEHVWAGGYRALTEGAYFAQQLATVRQEGRICPVPMDAGVAVHSAWDIGIDDCTAIWVAQQVGRQVCIIDYYEDRGQPAAHYARWLKDRGYDSGSAWLPHDAAARDKGTATSYCDHLEDAGIQRVEILPRTKNLLADIDRARSFLSRCAFDADRCREGLKALGSYRVEWDYDGETPKRKPVHDWTSHGADAFRALSQATLDPTGQAVPPRRDWRKR
jgi:phage terminase large subunit